MAGLLGFALSAGLGIARQQAQRKQQNQDLTVDALSKAAMQDPTILQNPGVQKEIKKARGDDFLSMLNTVGQLKQRQNQQFQQVLNPGSSAQNPSAMDLANPNVPVNSSTVQAAATSGGPSATAGAGGPNHENPQTVEDYQELKRRLMAAEGVFTDPAHQRLLQEHIQDADQNIARLTHQQDFNQVQQRLDQQHQDTEQDKAQTRALEEQGHAEMAAIAQGNLMLHADQDKFNQQMADWNKSFRQEQDSEKKQQAWNKSVESLQTETTKLGSMLTGANPSDPATVNQLLKQRNSMAATLKRQGAAAGYDADDDTFAPLTVKTMPGWLASHSGGMVGSSTSTLAPADDSAAVPTTATNPKTGEKMTLKGGKWVPAGA